LWPLIGEKLRRAGETELCSGGQLTAAAAPGLLRVGGGGDRGPEDLEDAGGRGGIMYPILRSKFGNLDMETG
jgi:hypothetical protein